MVFIFQFSTVQQKASKQLTCKEVVGHYNTSTGYGILPKRINQYNFINFSIIFFRSADNNTHILYDIQVQKLISFLNHHIKFLLSVY